MTTEHGTDTQERDDLWAYDALKEKPPTDAASASADASKVATPAVGTGTPTSNTQGADAKSSGESQASTSEDDSKSPLDGVDLDTLLKHPTLGPVLNQWSDKITNSRLEREGPRIRAQLEPEIRQTVEDEELTSYLDGLTDEERGQALATNPQLAVKWADIQKSRQVQTATPEEIARSAQVYSIATIIESHYALIDQTDLPDDVKTSLKDTTKYHEKGDEGVKEWVQAVQQSLIGHEADKKLQSQLDTRWESYKLEQQASQQRRPGLTRQGSGVAPVPPIDSPDSRDFLSAF